MKSALLAASLVLVGGTALGCSGGGGGAGAPTDASEEDYCAGYQSLFDDMSTMADATDAEIIAQIKDWAATMEETGTPEDMPEDARAGFETTMTLINDLDDDAQQEDFEKIDEDLSEDETAQVDEFDTYTTDTCGSPMDNLEVPEIPTETPSDPSQDARRAPVDDRGPSGAVGQLDAHPGGAPPSPALRGVEDDPALDPVVGERRSDECWLVVATASVSASTSAAGSTGPRSSTSVVAP